MLSAQRREMSGGFIHRGHREFTNIITMLDGDHDRAFSRGRSVRRLSRLASIQMMITTMNRTKRDARPTISWPEPHAAVPVDLSLGAVAGAFHHLRHAGVLNAFAGPFVLSRFRSF